MAASTHHAFARRRLCDEVEWDYGELLIGNLKSSHIIMESRHPHFTKRLKKLAFQQIAMRIEREVTALKKFSLRQWWGARDFNSQVGTLHSPQFLDDTIEPLIGTSNLDYLGLEINATPLNVSMEDAFQMLWNFLIPCSEEPQGEEMSPLNSSDVPLNSSVVHLQNLGKKERKVDNSHWKLSMRKHAKITWGAVGENSEWGNFCFFDSLRA
ncbi:hypothetical protein TNIN_349381 [Trichonephila inaurata madagascariensis]|uniref:Uncharacterized protein n=1 Tax=Trichonephila inaurata madagascariensis TaxID=2747483 RepID=A0A8X6XC31_9ARAC|nr:hypothetical protein TNIN_349381 [Trichonephila inaurata madagascariensis]